MNCIIEQYCNLHGGNISAISQQSGISADSIIDFSANINPAGPISNIIQIITASANDILNYPDPAYSELIESICSFGGWDRSMVAAGNGASELLYAAARLPGCKRALIPSPSYSDYTKAAELADLPVKHILYTEDNNFALDFNLLTDNILPGDIVFIGRPNNPTGYSPDKDNINNVITNHKNALFVIDESFIEFSDNRSIADNLPDNAIMVRSMTKFYAIPGLRLGYAVANTQITDRIRRFLTPWGINCFAARVGIASLMDRQYQIKSRENMIKIRDTFYDSLKSSPLIHVYPSESNFFLIKLNKDITGTELYSMLLKHRIAIRTCTNFTGLDNCYFRIAVKSENDNAYFMKTIIDIFKGQS